MLELPRRHLVGVVAVMFMLLLQLLMVVVANIGFDINCELSLQQHHPNHVV
jgi:hypothetical protein